MHAEILTSTCMCKASCCGFLGCAGWKTVVFVLGQGATVYPLGGGAPTELSEGKDIAFEEAAYELGPGGQGDFDSDVLRLGYSSLSTPYSTIDYNMSTGARSAHTCHAPCISGSPCCQNHTNMISMVECGLVEWIAHVYNASSLPVMGAAEASFMEWGRLWHG